MLPAQYQIGLNSLVRALTAKKPKAKNISDATVNPVRVFRSLGSRTALVGRSRILAIRLPGQFGLFQAVPPEHLGYKETPSGQSDVVEPVDFALEKIFERKHSQDAKEPQTAKSREVIHLLVGKSA